MNSSQLIGAIAGGDRAAFASLYRAKSASLIAYAAALLAGDRAGGEDAVDEAFCDVWRNAANYQHIDDGDRWLRRIVRNKAIDQLRKRREVLAEDPWQLGTSDAGQIEASPFDAACAADDAAVLRRALGRLSPEQREAVWLCYYEELSLKEIAIIAGCPENTVKTRLFHARQKLRAFVIA